MQDLHDWLSGRLQHNDYLYIKRLSANDTGATGGHQVGIYFPSSVIDALFPSVNHTRSQNPDTRITIRVSSHDCPESNARVIYYNSRFFGGTRNEKRITRLGGGSPLQDPENTGALVAFAFTFNTEGDSPAADIWVCRTPEEEDIFEASLGEVMPGTLHFGLADNILGGLISPGIIKPQRFRLPPEWSEHFPSGKEIIEYASVHYTRNADNPDDSLIARRKTEYDVFLQIEELHVLDVIRQGFGSVDEFIALANSVSNRRKSRAGKSLELHLEKLFIEYGLTHFSTQAITEGNKKPDFLFPSADDYHNPDFPEHYLRMLAVKTTCKDRWRQILNEANRIRKIHLFTLQEGVSPAQFREMKDENVILVVPSALHSRYPSEIRSELMTLGAFITELVTMYQSLPER
jgi:hypothetical protein